MDNAYQNGHSQLLPDETIYREALTTIAGRVNIPEVGELADKTLAAIKQRMVPDSISYGLAIQAWKNMAISKECENREAACKRALGLLQEMTKAYHRTTKVTVKPTTRDYNNVLEAFTVSKSPKATETAGALLSAFEEAAKSEIDGKSETGSLRPNANTYKFVFEILANSKMSNKVPRAEEVLQQMIQQPVQMLEEGSGKESILAAFNSFIRVCANPSVKDEMERRKIMKIAFKAVDDMRALGLRPNAGTYTALLEASHNLLPEGNDRQRVVETVFQSCCEEGYVDQTVLEKLQSAASTYLYTKLVVAHSEEVENMKVVPESWTRNITAFLVNTQEGRKVLPLSIEGKFTFTRAAADYKMRKLRRRENQSFLQGGRLK